MTIKPAKTGTGTLVVFNGLPVYYDFSESNSPNILGPENEKTKWIDNMTNDPDSRESLNTLLTDWKLYEKGWYVSNTNDKRLFNYLCQLGNSSRPDELSILNP